MSDEEPEPAVLEEEKGAVEAEVEETKEAAN